MKKKVLLVLLALLVAAVTAPAAKAVTPLRPRRRRRNTESVLILHGAFNYPGYSWDHTDLTVAVQAHPNVDEESLAAVHQEIADWDSALRQEFGGLTHAHRRHRSVRGQAQGRHRAAPPPSGQCGPTSSRVHSKYRLLPAASMPGGSITLAGAVSEGARHTSSSASPRLERSNRATLPGTQWGRGSGRAQSRPDTGREKPRRWGPTQ